MDDIDLDEIYREVIREHSVRPAHAQYMLNEFLKVAIQSMDTLTYARLERRLQAEFPGLRFRPDELD